MDDTGGSLYTHCDNREAARVSVAHDGGAFFGDVLAWPLSGVGIRAVAVSNGPVLMKICSGL